MPIFAEGDDPDVEEPMYYMKETKFPVGYLRKITHISFTVVRRT